MDMQYASRSYCPWTKNCLRWNEWMSHRFPKVICFNHFIHSNCFAGFCPFTVWFGFTRPSQRRRRSCNGWQVCSQDVTLHWLGSSESHATTVHRDIFFWKRCTYGRLIIVKDAGVLFGLNLIVYGGIITLKKDMCDPLAISCIHSYWMIWFCVALPTYIFSWIDLLIPITPKCGIFSWFPRRWSGEYVDLFQSLGCSILPSLGVGICSITAMAKTFVASFVSWFLPKIIGGHIYFLLQFFSFVLFGKKNIKQIRSEDWRFIREEVTRRFFPNEKASQNLEPEAGSWDLGESVWSQWSGLGFGGSTATWINWESKGTGNEDD